MSAQQAALIYTPLPDVEAAREIAAKLLEDRLIACANILGPMESLFAWDGKIESANETGVLLKTTADRLDETIARIAALHPYETPAIIGVVCDAAYEGTLDWLAEQTG